MHVRASGWLVGRDLTFLYNVKLHENANDNNIYSLKRPAIIYVLYMYIHISIASLYCIDDRAQEHSRAMCARARMRRHSLARA